MNGRFNHPDPGMLLSAGEPFGAGLCEIPDAAPVERYARAWRRWLEHTTLPEYAGGYLYPCGAKPSGGEALKPDYSRTFTFDGNVLATKIARSDPEAGRNLDALAALVAREQAAVHLPAHRHTVGGNAYTHAIVCYERVLHEGLDGYRARIVTRQTGSEAEADRAFYRAMLDMLDGIQDYRARLIDMLQAATGQALYRDRLIQALERVPFQPASNFYEAMVAYNFIFYIDGCDNPGRMDQVLAPFYHDPDDKPEAMNLIGDFADNVSACNGWSAALGGTDAEGRAAYNVLTEMIPRATRGRHRPSLELRVRRDMPDSVWEAAFDALASGNGQPAFYNEEAYLKGLRDADLGISEKDLSLWNGGGCTETMLHGCSNVGSLDAGFNLPLVLSDSLVRSLTPDATFASVLETFEGDLRGEIRGVLGRLNDHFQARARFRPQPMRSLLMDDCIDRACDFNAGGARYNWSVVNVAGLANVADALAALRVVVFEERTLAPPEMKAVLAADFAGREPLRRRLLACPKFGNDEPSVDALARRIADCVYGEITAFPCVRGGKFLPSHIMFETFASAGAAVGALPDGRRSGEPLADSVGPVQGRDTKGPTALLRSVARLPLIQAIGTPVLNLRFVKSIAGIPDGRKRLRALIEGYFRMGGMQVQFSLLDRDELEDALAHPERHDDLIVRIGGYSTYFNRLSPELKREVIKRTEYGPSDW
jgi:pyruvate-formate lyase